ncbi:LysM peptidoglycan-binding domain-containing protein [Metabacillus sp. FJAT-53654]|uniref:LysM peptidoglycan-binding domain-containing protein n=1 Tax=Metabacillus rhizosphaerae TaxID=3117747 RepID=A0ABZ2MM29_9BACI
MKQKLIGLTATAVVGSSLFTSIAAADNVKVESGDTLWELSHKYNTSVNTLMSLNGLKSDFLRVGQVLEIPGTTNNPSSGTPVKSETTQKTSTKAHKVKSGDSLWDLARAYGTSVTELKKLNGLKSDMIYVGQNLIVNKSTTESTGNSQTEEPVKQPTQTGTTGSYKVKSGDSLWKIANKYNLTIAEIKVANNLTSDMLRIGQVLKLTGEVNTSSEDKTVTPETTTNSSKVDKMISEAKALMGTPYRWAGNTPSGFDCSGFIYYVLNKVTSVSRLSTAGYWDTMKSISTPSKGDFVYFTTYKAGPSHMGIYLGNNEFIHASSSGVTISNLDNSYWKQRYLGAKRF